MVSMMAIMLGIFTVIGGIAAIWFFWDKIQPWLISKNIVKPSSKALFADSLPKEKIEKIILDSDPVNDWQKEINYDKSITYNKYYTNIRFEITYSGVGIQNANFTALWANKYPDPKAIGYWCNLYNESTLIERFILVSVDGGRAMLPVPRANNNKQHPLQITELDYKVAQIHDSLKTLSQYFGWSGLLLPNN